ncbi:MAG TPA: hypothetical protein EYP53_09325 [Candidatus Latescibacteria bacterium]|nr:hypothetical protein [Candidatus Latescibacterota bacterium]
MSKVLRIMAAGGMFVGLVLLAGCTGGTGVNYKDGRVYILNNTRFSWGQDGVTKLWVETLDGEKIIDEVDFHLDPDTREIRQEVEPVPLYDEELFPGGSEVEFYIKYNFACGVNKLLVKVPHIDGDITVEVYMSQWKSEAYFTGLPTYRLVPGRFTGSIYPPL